MHIVKKTFKPEHPEEEVTDPVCGMKLERRASKHILFRPDETVYFCSKECKQRFLDPTFRREAKKTA
jgi:YHS domain-containing protein